MNRKLPVIATLLGIGGLIPFFVCGLGALANPPPNDDLSLTGLVAYGAVILSFLGGVHWGFGLDAEGTAPPEVQRARFGLGVLPPLFGWAALLMVVIDYPHIALALLLVSFIVLTVIECRASREGYVPRGYMGLRWILSAVVVVCLTTVLLILMMHGRVALW